MGRFSPTKNAIVIDDVDDEDDDSMALPTKGKVSETLREELSKELGTNISNGADVDSVNLRIIKPKSGRVPFPYKKRLTGSIIIIVIAMILLFSISTIEYFIIAFITMISLGYVMAKKPPTT